jgi:hypothetical protein
MINLENLENLTDLVLLQTIKNLERELLLRTVDKAPVIPQEIIDFCYDNRELFEGNLELSDIDVGSVCFDNDTVDKIVYKAEICQGNEIFSWEIDEDDIKCWMNSDLVFEVHNEYNLSFIDLEIL